MSVSSCQGFPSSVGQTKDVQFRRKSWQTVWLHVSFRSHCYHFCVFLKRKVSKLKMTVKIHRQREENKCSSGASWAGCVRGIFARVMALIHTSAYIENKPLGQRLCIPLVPVMGVEASRSVFKPRLFCTLSSRPTRAPCLFGFFFLSMLWIKRDQ